MESLQRVVRSFDVGIAIVCVPKAAAQQVAAGSSRSASRPSGTSPPPSSPCLRTCHRRNENIAIGLAILSHYLKRRQGGGLPPAAARRSGRTLPQKLIDIFTRDQPKREFLVQILEETQKAFGWISRESVSAIADFLSIPPEQVVETAAFYPVFRLEPLARWRVVACRGENCARAGSVPLLDAISRELAISDGETTADGLFSLESSPCRGMCSQAPAVTVNDEPLRFADVEGLLRHLRELRASATSPS